MLPAAVPAPKDDATRRAHLRANVQAAAAGDRHPGDWRQHFYALPEAPGDFTPVTAPDYAETGGGIPLLGELREHIAEFLGPDHSKVISQRGLEAAQ